MISGVGNIYGRLLRGCVTAVRQPARTSGSSEREFYLNVWDKGALLPHVENGPERPHFAKCTLRANVRDEAHC